MSSAYRMKKPRSLLCWDSFSSTQASTSSQVRFSSQRSIEQPSHCFSSHSFFQCSRIAIDRVTSDRVGAHMTPPGTMKLECGHCPPKIAYTSTGLFDSVTPRAQLSPVYGEKRRTASSYSGEFA